MFYEQLRSLIKEKKFAPLYIFEGPEEYLIDFCITEIKKSIVEPWSEMMNYKSFTEIPPVDEARDFSEMLPVMAERKLIIFRKCGLFSGNIKNKAVWEQFFSNVAPFCCIIVWEESPEKGKKQNSVRMACEAGGAVVVSFPLRDDSSLKTWTMNICASKGKSIDQKNALYLINSLERKMSVIKTELEKIISYSKGNEIIREDIDSVIIKPAMENVFGVIDAIFDGRREICYNLLYSMRTHKQESVSILSLLSGQLLLIYKAKLHLLSGKPHSEVSQIIGGGFSGEKCTRKAEKIKLENIQKLISLCFEADKNIKQGLIGGWAALEGIVAEYKFY